MTWLGYFATTGLDTMDYVLASAAVLPPGDEWQWTEKPWRLPRVYSAFAPPRDGPSVAPTPALKNGFLTFASFNNIGKLTPDTIEDWARILTALPTSRLELRSSLALSPEVETAVRAAFRQFAVSDRRIGLSPTIQDYDEHLNSYANVDIALDTHPFTGATTSCEALWMGVPVMTRRGDRYVARMGESILSAIGRPEWIATDRDDYVNRTVALAADINVLQSIRQSLRQAMQNSPLTDLDGFARDLGEAFEGMWDHWSAGHGVGTTS